MMRVKQVAQSILCFIFLFCLACDGNANDNGSATKGHAVSKSPLAKRNTDARHKTESKVVTSMKLFINDKEIPVVWEKNASVSELMSEVAKGEMTVKMSMYSDNEQVGSLGRTFTSNDKKTTTHSGDIVLYSSKHIVLFYGSNSWSYTRLGRMDLPEQAVIDLLSHGDVIIKLRRS